jgi:hypothetical protein
MKSTTATLPLLRVFFDESCGLCGRVAWVLGRLGNRGRVEFWPARDLDRFTDDRRARADRYTDMVSLADTELYIGYDTYVQIAARTTALRLLRPLMQLRSIRKIGEPLYHRISRSRRCMVAPPPASTS